MTTKSKKKVGRPLGDHVKCQRDIADALLKVIGEHGIENASMRAVAREAKCTTGVLVHYFASKEDLVCHAVDLLFDWAIQQTELAARETDSTKALHRVFGIGDAQVQGPFDFWAVWLQVLPRAKGKGRLTSIITKRHGQFRRLLSRIVRNGQLSGQIRSDIPANLLADHLCAITDGVGLMAPIETQYLTKRRVDALAKLSILFALPKQ